MVLNHGLQILTVQVRKDISVMLFFLTAAQSYKSKSDVATIILANSFLVFLFNLMMLLKNAMTYQNGVLLTMIFLWPKINTRGQSYPILFLRYWQFSFCDLIKLSFKYYHRK